jgi:hypothetical protein
MSRIKHIFTLVVALGLIAIMGTQTARADIILLTGGGWTFNPSSTVAYKDFSVGGESLRVTMESWAYEYASGNDVAATLSQGANGFGVISSVGSSSLLDSNGTGREGLTVTFSKNVTVTGYGMSSWSTGSGFTPKVFNFNPYLESYLPVSGGSVDANGFTTFSFAGKPLVGSDFLRFYGDTFSSPNDDLGWARLDVTVDAAPVPIPAAVWLLGSGLIGLIGVRRFRK